jgi:hypothetical protein
MTAYDAAPSCSSQTRPRWSWPPTRAQLDHLIHSNLCSANCWLHVTRTLRLGRIVLAAFQAAPTRLLVAVTCGTPNRFPCCKVLTCRDVLPCRPLAPCSLGVFGAQLLPLRLPVWWSMQLAVRPAAPCYSQPFKWRDFLAYRSLIPCASAASSAHHLPLPAGPLITTTYMP